MRRCFMQNSKLFKRVKSMEKRLNALVTSMIGEADPLERTMRFQSNCKESGDIVLQAKNLQKALKNSS
ncbi:MAG: hypothetical protein R2880_21710 [Deinococcales bacterium]